MDELLETAAFMDSLLSSFQARERAETTLGTTEMGDEIALGCFLHDGCLQMPAAPPEAGGAAGTHLDGAAAPPSQRPAPFGSVPANAADAATTKNTNASSIDSAVSSDCGSEMHPFELLADLSDLDSLQPCAALQRVWLATFKGSRVAVKLACGLGWVPRGAAAAAIAAASRVRHPHILTIYDVRAAALDEQAEVLLAPFPAIRPGWRAPPAIPTRLHHFLHARWGPQPEPTGTGLPSTTTALQPGLHLDLQPLAVQAPPLPPRPNGPASRALAALRLGGAGGVGAVVMEYCEMGDLHTLATSPASPFRASRSWPLHVAQRALLRTARELAGALLALHSAGISHGALKPSNVLLAHSAVDRRGWEVRLADAGCSDVLSAVAPSGPAPPSPAMLLAAPEVLLAAGSDSGGASPAADVYSFGLVLYVMAAGEMPYRGHHLGERRSVALCVEALLAVACGDAHPEWPEDHQHPHLGPLFRRCVAHEPGDRPGMQQVAAELEVMEAALKAAKAARR
ncbi:Serine/threonine-protein kinase-transforming protein raf [Tetrabaena socialis]|uniref:Serine/threonine-protein kinase-transforming protein raf n=1 Tax=Tetrabaena socialis TaxID=47790 RepID=A0A2J7ZMD0_9CHLO|nr:Serine/threonine-protein kinase-transforming protein raf [Tetrabaena socialis]|eukprot:PNH01415.1 Serine/threonine-protein kinase-transforming protein raf [Tetrabaena socialis]